MKLTNGISLFNKKSSKVQKINKNDILDKNCNFSVPLIENEISNQKKNYSKEKVTLLKSFYTKNDKSKSKSKSNSNSKEYRRRNRSNYNYGSNNVINIRNQNAYFNNNTSYNQNKSKYIFNSYIVTPLYGLKIYEKTLNKIFEYIKSILPKKIFLEIKKMYIKYVLEELHIKNNITNILFSKSESEIMSLNLKLFYNKDNKSSSVNRSSSKNSKNKSLSKNKNKNKNQKDISFTRNYNRKGININTRNSQTAKNNISKQYIFNGIFNNQNKNHNSLYTLSKNYSRIPGMPFTFNITKNSAMKSKSKSSSKEKKIVSKNSNKNYYSNNNIFDPDAHVYKILNQRNKNNSNNILIKNRNNTSNNNKVKKQLTNNLLLSKKGKNNIATKNRKLSPNNNLVKSDNKNENLNNDKKIFKKESKNKKEEKKEDNNKNNEKLKENKNEDQLKQIKSGLDDNLKFLFNFSYENFLNKESENDSKKTVSDYNNV